MKRACNGSGERGYRLMVSMRFARSVRHERAFKRYATNQQRQSWTCVACGHHLHPTAGTIFHKSSTSLHLWFYAMYMITSTRCGISAKQLGRELGVTYKTAWRIFNRIRYSLYDDHTPLDGHVEMDETLIGGKDENRHLSKRSGAMGHYKGKTAVFGMVQRGGKSGRLRCSYSAEVRRSAATYPASRNACDNGFHR